MLVRDEDEQRSIRDRTAWRAPTVFFVGAQRNTDSPTIAITGRGRELVVERDRRCRLGSLLADDVAAEEILQRGDTLAQRMAAEIIGHPGTTGYELPWACA